MERREALGLIGLAGLAAATCAEAAPSVGEPSVPSPSVKDQLVGTWSIVQESNYSAKDGTDVAVAPNQRGHICYDKAGRVFVLFWNDDRMPPKDTRNITVDEYRAMLTGLVSFYGTFDVDEVNKKIINHIQAAHNPAWIGTDFIRGYELTGDMLRLALPGEPSRHVFLEKLPDS